MAPRIPPRQPIGDPCAGVIVQVAEQHIFSTTALPDAQTVQAGTFMLRYGIRYLEKPFMSIVPGLVALDYGQHLNGEEAWTFLLKHSNLHPRADVLGYRNDGTDEMVVLKKLDLMQPLALLVYADAAATQPLAECEAVIAPADNDLPERLLAYIPRYDTLADWREQHG